MILAIFLVFVKMVTMKIQVRTETSNFLLFQGLHMGELVRVRKQAHCQEQVIRIEGQVFSSIQIPVVSLRI